jgi:hypothetical protein
MKREIWKDIKGQKGRVQVSNRGRVRDIHLNGDESLRGLCITSKGYPTTQLKRDFYFVHTLVIQAFVGPRPKGYVIHHKDGNPTNAHLSNLEYISPSDHANKHYKMTKCVKHITGQRNVLMIALQLIAGSGGADLDGCVCADIARAALQETELLDNNST